MLYFYDIFSAYAEQPFIRIAQCQNLPEICAIPIKDSQHWLELECSVIGVKPLVVLVWTTSGMENTLDQFVAAISEKQPDGTWNVGAKLRIPIGDIGEDANMLNFTCTATGAAVNGMVNETVYVSVSTDSNGKDRTSIPQERLQETKTRDFYLIVKFQSLR